MKENMVNGFGRVIGILFLIKNLWVFTDKFLKEFLRLVLKTSGFG